LGQQQILQRIDEARRTIGQDQKHLNDLAYALGIAWGETLVRELEWRWEMLMAENGQEALAVVSPNRALAATVLLFLKGLLRDRDAEATTWLTFNMVKTGEFRAAPGELKLIT
jgi:hypothetical protein